MRNHQEYVGHFQRILHMYYLEYITSISTSMGPIGGLSNTIRSKIIRKWYLDLTFGKQIVHQWYLSGVICSVDVSI